MSSTRREPVVKRLLTRKMKITSLLEMEMTWQRDHEKKSQVNKIFAREVPCDKGREVFFYLFRGTDSYSKKKSLLKELILYLLFEEDLSSLRSLIPSSSRKGKKSTTSSSWLPLGCLLWSVCHGLFWTKALEWEEKKWLTILLTSMESNLKGK